jgi:hypothetical protein
VHAHAGADLVRRVALAPPRDHVDRLAAGRQRFGELAHVASEAALDDGRVLPGQDQDAAAHAAAEPIPRGRNPRRAAETGCGAAMTNTFAELDRDTVIVADGRVLERNLRRQRMTVEEVEAEARLQQIGSLDDVRFAVLETNGKISFATS